MRMSERVGVLVLLPFVCACAVLAQSIELSRASGSSSIQLDVVVTDKAGAPVSGLQPEDFTLLDNDVPQSISSFEPVEASQVKVILVLDAVNSDSRDVAIERAEIKKFLKSKRGRLAVPTTFAVLTETGIKLHLGFSQDGEALSSALGDYRVPRRSGGRAGVFKNSFDGFAQLVEEEREQPGRKLMIWISPGWPVVRGNLDAAQKEQIFGNVVEVSRELREGRITLYNVDPSGTADIEVDMGMHLRPSNEKVQVAGASNPEAAGMSDLALGVLALQSGGLALHPGNDLASDLQKCVADAEAYYEISFRPAIGNQPNEYHHLEIRVARLRLTPKEEAPAAKNRQGKGQR